MVSSINKSRSSVSISLPNETNFSRYLSGKSSLPAYAIWIGRVEPRPFRISLIRWQAYWKSLFPRLTTMPFEPFLNLLRRAWKGSLAGDRGFLMYGKDAIRLEVANFVLSCFFYVVPDALVD